MNDWYEAEQHVERAHEHYEAGRWAEAEHELREALSINPDRPEWYFNLGLTQEAAGRFDAAMESLSRANELAPDDPQVLTLLGSTAVRAGRHESAIGWLERAAALSDDHASEALIWQIEAKSALGHHEEAELAFYESLQRPGDHALAYANIAESLLDRGENDRAAYCLREASTLDPSLPRVHARLAEAMTRTGRHERARQLYLRELRDAPGDVDTLLDLGCLLVDMNRLAEAGEKFRRVLEIEADNTEAHFCLGDLALRQHRLKEAEAAFGLVLRLDESFPEVRRRLAELHVRRGELLAARRLLRHELDTLWHRESDFPDDDVRDLAELLLDVRLHRDAVKVLRVLCDRLPDRGEAWHLLALALFESGDRPGGLIAARRAVRLDPGNVRALHNLAYALMQERQWSRARAYLRQALSVDSEDAGLRRLRLWMRLSVVTRWVRRRVGVPAHT
ncbi:MAG: tetratricopeptide repeat protein [Planctomycetota bacterium]